MRSVAFGKGLPPGREDRAAGSGPAPAHRLGRYHLIAELARGGMGIVYLALAHGPGAFHKLLVLKELKPELRTDPGFVGMFMEEARLAACLSHPNVVHTVEAGSDGDRRYIAMEYLDGQPLHRIVSRARRQGSPASFAWQTSVLCCAIEGLAHAHSARDYDGRPLGIVHRDMTPHNVMVGYDGHVKVLDFGIAKATAFSAETQSGLLRGKVAYMSPEQAAGLPLDRRADVFAVGVMLWEAATGRRFWAGLDNDMAVLHALFAGRIGTSRDRSMAEIPGQLQYVIARATARRPEDRYEDAMALLTELRSALTSCGVATLAAAEIGRFAHDHFSEDRAKLQASIDRALTLARRPGSGVGTTSSADRLPAAGRSPSQRDDRPPASYLVDLGWDETPSDVPLPPVRGSTSHTSEPPPFSHTTVEASGSVGAPHSGVAGAGAAMLTGVVMGVAALVLLLQYAAHRSSTSAPRSLPPVAAAVEPAPADIRLLVRASPPNARVRVDDRILPGNPYAITLPRDGASHTVLAEADGFVSREDRFDATGDMTLVIALEHREPSPPPTGSTPEH
jgi:eukaryotic-like serine/threonine-protein kinase